MRFRSCVCVCVCVCVCDGVYELLKAIASNPCGEQWLPAYDACRLLAANMFNFVVNPFKKGAVIDYNKVYEVFYVQQRLADDIVDLETLYRDWETYKLNKEAEKIMKEIDGLEIDNDVKRRTAKKREQTSTTSRGISKNS